MDSINDKTPPKTRLTFNIGVTGHRNFTDADMGLLCKKIDEVFEEIIDIVHNKFTEIAHLHRKESPAFRVISMLAEGSDRIVAKRGMAKGCYLQCPLPMSKDEYEKDFINPDSKNEFKDLISKAQSVFEIKCSNEVRSRAYQDGGMVMLSHSDVLIAVWNGHDSGAIGGTSDMVEKAMQQDIPIVWIDSERPHTVKVMYAGRVSENWNNTLKKCICEIILPYKEESSDQSVLENYFNEAMDRRNRATLYRNFTRILSFKKGEKRGTNKDLPQNDFYSENYKKHFTCADSLALYYGDYYKSLGILRQLLPFFASIGLVIGFYVSLVVGPNPISSSQKNAIDIASTIGFLIQVICLTLIIILSKREKKLKLHQKFLNYRSLAELLRQMELLGVSGLVVRGMRVPAYNKQLNISWVNWHFRAIVREAGLPNMVLDSKKLEDYKTTLKEKMVRSQMVYHLNNGNKLKIIVKRLEKFGISVYYLGIIVTSMRMGVRFLTAAKFLNNLNSYQQSYLSTFFNMLSMFIPLFAVVAFSISTQEGFDRLQIRSYAMFEKLNEMLQKVEILNKEDFTSYKKIIEETTDLMLSEFTDWNAFIMSKNISEH